MDVYKGKLSLWLSEGKIETNKYTGEALRVYWSLMEYLSSTPRRLINENELKRIHELAPYLFLAYSNGSTRLPNNVYLKYQSLIEEMERLGMVKVKKKGKQIILDFYISAVDPSDERVRIEWGKNYPTFLSDVEQQVRHTLESIL